MVARTRNARGIYPKTRSCFTKSPGKSKALPEFLEQAEVEALLRHAPHPQTRLLMLMQWRADLHVSEAIAITLADLTLESDQLTVRVRLGKGAKDRMVPVHPELREVIYNIVYYRASDGPIIGVSRQAAYQWMQQALAAAVRAGGIPKRQTNRDSRPTPQFRASHDRKRNPAQPTVGLVGPRITSYDGDLPAAGPGYRWAYGWIP